MNASQPAARRIDVSAIVTAAVAAWFVLATGTAFAEPGQPGAAAATPGQVTLTPEGTMKLTVIAARPATQIALTPEGTMKLTVVAARPATQIALTPEGAMKLTVAAQRTQTAPVHTAAVREASRS